MRKFIGETALAPVVGPTADTIAIVDGLTTESVVPNP